MTTPPPNPDALSERVLYLENKLAEAELELCLREMRIEQLQARLKLELLRKYGRASEKLDPRQLTLLELEPGVNEAEVALESERGPLPAAPSRKPRRKHPGRQSLPAHLPRVEKVIPCSAEQCVCRQCGEPTEVIGYEQSEQLDCEPARYFVLVSKREKRACRGCEAAGVATAPAPARIVEKALVSDRVVVNVVVAKYCDHLPLYRQSAIWERETGLGIGRATMDGWVMQVGESLRPLVEQMRRELVSGEYIQADETPVGVQTHDKRGKNHQGYLWQYGRPAGPVVFDFRMGRGREGPAEFLRQFRGRLQTDGYIGYDKVGLPGLVRAGCWTHTRRKFWEAVQVNPRDLAALGMVQLIDQLFAIDAEARELGLEAEARDWLRQQRSRPLLETIREQIAKARAGTLPASALGKALSYAEAQWPRLERFLEYPELELSTNLAENSMRPVALGRKNWIHIGSPQAGPRVAAILSVVETCRRMKIPVRAYLGAVLPGLADLPVRRTADLTPSAWAARNG